MKESVQTEKYSDEAVLSFDLSVNLERLLHDFGSSTDLVIRKFWAFNRQIAVVHIDGLIEKQSLQEAIIKPILACGAHPIDDDELITYICQQVLSVGGLTTLRNRSQVYVALFSGHTVLFLDGGSDVITCSTEGWEARGVTESTSEVVVRGPKEAFTETLRTNTALIRKRIKSPNLRVEAYKMGSVSVTSMALLYLEGAVNPETLKKIKDKLSHIQTEAMFDTGMLEEYVQEKTYTVFPTIMNTERPDVVAANIVEGRMGLIVDGSPFVLVLPVSFTQFLHSSEDYSHRADISSLIRLLRYIFFLISLFLPSIYVAAIMYHQEMIPTKLMISVAAQREGVPFPAIVEAFMMEVTFEVLREAGIRMPRAIGQAVSIVGALVLGEAAVQAGLVSPAMVIIVSVTAIANFTTPGFNLGIAARMLRFVFLALAGFMGIYGIVLGSLVLVAHLVTLDSFGVPYMSPMAPFNLSDQKDNILRFPAKFLTFRPAFLKNAAKKRKS
jgi:spore germination protein KA